MAKKRVNLMMVEVRDLLNKSISQLYTCMLIQNKHECDISSEISQKLD